MAFKYKHLWHSDAAVNQGISNYPGVDVGANPALTADYINNNLSLLYQNVISPLMNAWAAVPAFAASKKANPAPVSNKLIEIVRFLRAVRFGPRLAAIFVLVGVLPTGTPLYSYLGN